MKKLMTLLALLPLSLFAQNYEVEKYGEEINTEFDEVQPLLSPDGNRLYFVRVDHPENYYGANNSQDIWVSTKNEDGSWTEAERVEADFNNARNKAFVWSSKTGERFLLTGRYAKNGTWKGRGLSEVNYLDGKWTKPVEVKLKAFKKKNKGRTCNVFVTSEEDLMFLSYTKKWDKVPNRLYMSKMKKKSWSRPKRIKKKLKSFSSIDAPFYVPADSAIYFSGRSRKYDCPKQADIFMIKVLDQKFKKFSEPTKVEGLINTLQYDSYYSMSEEGIIHLASARSGEGDADLYFLIPITEDQFLYLSGNLKNSRTSENLKNVEGLIIKVGGKVFSEAKIKQDGTYTMTLPLGESYEILAEMDGYTTEAVTVDVTGDKEFVQKRQDLMLTPPPFVLVTGFIINQKTGEKITAEAAPTILFNGVVVDSISYNPDEGYAVKIPWGEKYKLAGQATDYESVSHSLDLSGVSEYKEIEQDLLVVPAEKFVSVKGTVVNGNDLRPMPSTIDYKILVDGNEPNRYELNKGTAQYELYLKPGKKYEINADCEDYVPNYVVVDLTSEEEAKDAREQLKLTPIKVGQHVVMDNIFFEHASAKLSPESNTALDHLVRLLNDHDHLKIEIGGHTDSQGSDAYNQTLSENRAKSVQEYLVSKSIDGSRLSFKGYGESTPVASNKTPWGRGKNRRVEFTILEE